MLEGIQMKKAKPPTTTEKGEVFEKKVATWLKRQIKPKELLSNQFFKGKTAVRPHQVDLVVRTKNDYIIWVECKDRKGSIKRTDILKLANAAKDVKDTVGLYWTKPLQAWDYLFFVSTAKFDADAINFAKQQDMGCYYYDGKTFQEENKIRHFRI